MGRSAAPGTRRIASLALCAIVLLAGAPLDCVAKASSAPAFDWGYRLRLRQEYLANVYDFDENAADDTNYLRVRSQLWGSWAPNAEWKLFAMLNNEHRHWFKSNKGLEDRDFEIHELVFENLYVQGTKIGGTPFGFTLGRQNMMYGDGFVCWDGGPLDGSRTAYFNALLVNAVFDRRKIEAHVLSDPSRDDYLPVINDQEQRLVESRETGAGLYYTDKSIEGHTIEAYYFYKHETAAGDARPEADVHAIGARASGSSGARVSYAAEAALQTGDRGGRDILAAGAQLTGKYIVATERFPFTIAAGGIYLSGDDPGSADAYEGWDPLYSRWPKWSDLYIYSLGAERGAAYWDNLAAGWLGVDVKLPRRLFLEEKIYAMWAPEGGPAPAFAASSGRRGTLSLARLSATVNERLGAYLLWEAFVPGDYYVEGNDTAHFLRWEMMATF